MRDLLRDYSVDHRPILDEAGLSLDHGDDLAWISLERFIRALTIAARVTGDRYFGLKHGTRGRFTANPLGCAAALASLVEREARFAMDRPLISSVFHNRLKIGMKLDCDPTTIYALKRLGAWRGALARSELAVEARRFADEEVFVEINENVRGEDVFVIQPTCSPVNDHVMELLIMLDAFRRADEVEKLLRVVPGGEGVEGLHDVVHRDEVARLSAVLVDDGRVVVQEPRGEDRGHAARNLR